jgi:hypothetical protein
MVAGHDVLVMRAACRQNGRARFPNTANVAQYELDEQQYRKTHNDPTRATHGLAPEYQPPASDSLIEFAEA